MFLNELATKSPRGFFIKKNSQPQKEWQSP